MKKITIILSICAFVALFLMGNIYKAAAGDVDVNIGINVPLPGLVIAEPPALVVIPGTYVYFAPDVGADIFFYHDHWYRHHDGGWYIASGFNGPWRGVRRTPAAFVNLPPNYRRIPPGHQRMPYGHVKSNWRGWERERYWDKHEVRARGGFDQGGGPSEGRGRGKGKHWKD
jgi:hypothetical protein